MLTWGESLISGYLQILDFSFNQNADDTAHLSTLHTELYEMLLVKCHVSLVIGIGTVAYEVFD